jgi:hypothetical protein
MARKQKNDHKFNIVLDGLIVDATDDRDMALIMYMDWNSAHTVTIVNSIDKDITDQVLAD